MRTAAKRHTGIKISDDLTVADGDYLWFIHRDNHSKKWSLEHGRICDWGTGLVLMFVNGQSMGIKIPKDHLFATQEAALKSDLFNVRNFSAPRTEVAKIVENAKYAAACDFSNNDTEVTHEIQLDFAKQQIAGLCELIERTYGISIVNLGDNPSWRIAIQPYGQAPIHEPRRRPALMIDRLIDKTAERTDFQGYLDSEDATDLYAAYERNELDQDGIERLRLILEDYANSRKLDI